MPIITVNMLDGRTVEQKRKIAARLTQVICEELGKKPENVRIMFNEIPLDNYAVAGILKSDEKLTQQITI